ncbi:MAG: aldehyde dehydrogenase family protein, partial [Limisphaerales bacterium]
MKTKARSTRHASRSPAAVTGSRVQANGAAHDARPVVPLRERRLQFGSKWDYAPAPEAASHIRIAPRQELFLNGKFVAPSTGKYFDSINPANEEKLTEIALAGAGDVNTAVRAARRAYDNVWGRMPGRQRGKYLYRIARLIQEKARELAILETMD